MQSSMIEKTLDYQNAQCLKEAKLGASSQRFEKKEIFCQAELKRI